MSEMIARIAESMRKKLVGNDDGWQYAEGEDPRRITLDGTFDLTELAMVAVQTMREPTAEMVAIGAHEDHPESVKWIWAAMIDAALTGGK